jgi:hypothetical protein
MRVLLSTICVLPLLLGAAECGTGIGGGGDDACGLASEYQACPECADGITTCVYEDFSETEVSCQECQARGALYQTLCSARVSGRAIDIEFETFCTTDPL